MSKQFPFADTKCVHCHTKYNLVFRGELRKDGKCKIRVECDRCGNFSHYVPLGAKIERAIARLVDEAILQSWEGGKLPEEIGEYFSKLPKKEKKESRNYS
jgi:hypothetical protein